MATLFHNGRFFQSGILGENHSFAECMIVDGDGKIVHVGSTADEQVRQVEGQGITKQDVGGRVVLPGFIDGHMHLLMMGQSLQKAALEQCKSFEDIRRVLKQFA